MKRLLCLLLCCLGAAAHAGHPAGGSWRVALIGDTPYSEHERRELPAMLARIAATHADLVLHVGDFKDGRSPCSDALFEDRRALFDAQPGAFVFVPGDNEWSDCGRKAAGGHDPLERLARLRALFFAEARTLGRQPLAVERQSAQRPEHLRWRLGPVLFVTLNVPGGNNIRGPGKPRSEFAARNPQVIAWLREAFALARGENLRGVVVAMQANPGFREFASGQPYSGYRRLLEVLREETQDFTGEVLLVHGDTHWQRIDTPLRHATSGRPLANFTRVETFGAPFMGWVRLHIDAAGERLFRLEAHPHPER